jgi:NTE family protein
MDHEEQSELLAQLLRNFLGPVDGGALDALKAQLEWVEVAAGQTLMAQGDPGDSMYLSVSGRLRAYVRDEDGVEHMVREMARGQVIGEMALYTDEPRSATVVAIRDSVLVRLGKPQFQQLLQGSVQASIALTRQLIRRLQSSQTRSDLARPVSVGLIPVTQGVDAWRFSERLGEELQKLLPHGSVCLVDAARVDQDLGQPGLARSVAAPDSDTSRRIALLLDRLEMRYDYVLLVADSEPTPWTERCTRRSDELLLLAQAGQPPRLHPSEERFLMNRGGRSEAAEILVLMHPEDRRCPQGTRHWLARRPVSDHVHIRPTLARDMARLARLQSRQAVGLVLAGGGARGVAHLGIVRALKERGVEIDCVGGTSMGAVIGALVAADVPVATMTEVSRTAFSTNPTGDINWMPLLSLIRGQRLRKAVQHAAQQVFGCEPDVEDLWKNYYCVASNFSQASEQVLRDGPLVQALLASAAIPGALPPVMRQGDLLCDGGTFNNFPVDLMRVQRGVGKVAGVDLSFRKPRKIALDEVPGSWALLLDRLRPRSRRRYRFPSLTSYLMNVTVLYSTSRQRLGRRLTDLYFNPPLERVGMLQWEKFDHIVDLGHAHATEVLGAMSAEQFEPYIRGNDEHRA